MHGQKLEIDGFVLVQQKPEGPPHPGNPGVEQQHPGQPKQQAVLPLGVEFLKKKGDPVPQLNAAYGVTTTGIDSTKIKTVRNAIGK